MNQHSHGHIFRERDVDRVITAYGRPPSETKRQELHSLLRQEKNRFIEIHRLKQLEKERRKGRGR